MTAKAAGDDCPDEEVKVKPCHEADEFDDADALDALIEAGTKEELSSPA